MAVQLTLFGGVEARLESGERILLPTGKIAGLLAYLAMGQGRAKSREALATFFWEDSAEEQARGSLRYALAVLRHALAPAQCPILFSDRQHVWLSEAELTVDALRFERLLAVGAPHALEEALAFYRGEFLEGLGIRSESFEEWVRGERMRLREMAESALAHLVRHCEALGETDRAIQSALTLLALDPLREDVHRSLIGLYVGQGRRADALRHYERCRDALRRELGVEPEEATRRLVEPLQTRSPGGPEPRAGWIADPLRRHMVGAGTEPEAPPASSVPGMGSIAVRPFRLLRQSERARLAAVILREGLEFALSRFRELRVVVHRDSPHFKAPTRAERRGEGRDPDFVVDGSLLDDEGTLNVSVRLIDARPGSVCWGKELGGRASDRRGLGEAAVGEVVASIHAVLERIHLDHLRAVAGGGLGGFPLALLARAEINKLTRPALETAVRLARQAQRLDAACSLAFSTLAVARVFQVRMGWAAERSQALSEARDAASEALALDYGDAVAHGAAGLAHLWSGAHDMALRAIQRGLDLNPNRTELLHWKGLAHDFSGEHEDAIPCHRAALSMAPQHPAAFATANALAGACYQLGDYGEAAGWARESIAMCPGYRRSHAVLAASLARLGDESGSASALAKAMAVDSRLSLKTQIAGYIYKETRSVAAWERGYRTAGLH